jgi:hypothetical protein
MATVGIDSSALRIHLNELTSVFDQRMCEGAEFATLKPIYMQIKELEWHLKVLEWQEHIAGVHQERMLYSDGRPLL